MTFATPFLVLLGIPLIIVAWNYRHHAGSSIRWLALITLILALAGPRWRGAPGGDVVIIFDRSDSMPAAAIQRQTEMLRSIASQRQDGDRLAILAVADEVQILQAPHEHGTASLDDVRLDGKGSRLAAALRTAGSLIPPDRPGRVLLHSDGLSTDAAAQRASGALAARNIQVDVLPVAIPPQHDAAVVSMQVPANLRLGEQCLIAATIRSTADTTANWQLRRIHGHEQAIIAEATIELAANQDHHLHIAEQPVYAGIVEYQLELVHDDRQHANNKRQTATMVTGGEAVLVISRGLLIGKALRAAGMTVAIRPPQAISLSELSSYRAVVLDQVPASALSHAGLVALHDWVRHHGGGLFMSGGRGSFGAGGYHQSPVADILPVSLEIRDEQRRLAASMAIALDRSGSMGAPAGLGRSKMDLANAGSAAALDLLGPDDSIAVYAVDSSAHEVVPPTRIAAANREQLRDRILRIESRGGGIFIDEAVTACIEASLSMQAGTQHVILFADAADAENPADSIDVLRKAYDAGMTCSVIGLGSPHDSDAQLLRDLANAGGGRIYFADDAGEIPRLFAQETILISRTAWVNEPTQPKLNGLALGLLPELPALPIASGYNVVHPRPTATIYGDCPGDPSSPLLTGWQIGHGRSLALTIALDDEKNIQWPGWDGYGNFVASLTRWCAGSERNNRLDLRSQTIGAEAILTLEIAEELATHSIGAVAEIVLTGDKKNIATEVYTMRPLRAGVWQATVPLPRSAPQIPVATIHINDANGATKTLSSLGPPLLLPQSPEAHLSHPGRGTDLLQDMAERSGGRIRDGVAKSFDFDTRGTAWHSLTPWLFLVLALLWPCEIAARRWQLALSSLPAFKAIRSRYRKPIPKGQHNQHTRENNSKRQRNTKKAEVTEENQKSETAKKTPDNNNTVQKALEKIKAQRQRSDS